MLRIALLTLAHDHRRLIAAWIGVTFAATLVLVQVGIYAGFRETASLLIRRMGGDVWVMPRGTEAFENVEPMGRAARDAIYADECVRSAHAVVFVYVNVRQASGALLPARLIGVDRRDAGRVIGELRSGDVSSLARPLSVVVDEGDSALLHGRGGAPTNWLMVDRRRLDVVGRTSGNRSLAPSPYLFSALETARRLAGTPPDAASMWAVDLKSTGCVDRFVASLSRRFDLQALPAAEWARRTEHHWISGSGAGVAVGVNAALGLFVGAIIVGQILLNLANDNLREIATLKALGAASRSTASFVLWQAAVLAVVGGVAGFGASWVVRYVGRPNGLTVVISAGTVTVSAIGVLLMCALASVIAVRAIERLTGAEVFA